MYFLIYFTTLIISTQLSHQNTIPLSTNLLPNGKSILKPKLLKEKFNNVDYCHKENEDICGLDQKVLGCELPRPTTGCSHIELHNMSNYQIGEIVSEFNRVRMMFGRGAYSYYKAATKMREVSWSDELQYLAELQLSQCSVFRDKKICYLTSERELSFAIIGSKINNDIELTIRQLLTDWSQVSKPEGVGQTKNKYFYTGGHESLAYMIHDKLDKIGCAVGKYKFQNQNHTALICVCNKFIKQLSEIFTPGETCSECKTYGNRFKCQNNSLCHERLLSVVQSVQTVQIVDDLESKEMLSNVNYCHNEIKDICGFDQTGNKLRIEQPTSTKGYLGIELHYMSNNEIDKTVSKFNEVREMFARGVYSSFKAATKMREVSWSYELQYLAELQLKQCSVVRDKKICYLTSEREPSFGIIGSKVSSDVESTYIELLKDWSHENKTEDVGQTKNKYIYTGRHKSWAYMVHDKLDKIGCAAGKLTFQNQDHVTFICVFNKFIEQLSEIFTPGEPCSECKTYGDLYKCKNNALCYKSGEGGRNNYQVTVLNIILAIILIYSFYC